MRRFEKAATWGFVMSGAKGKWHVRVARDRSALCGALATSEVAPELSTSGPLLVKQNSGLPWLCAKCRTIGEAHLPS